MTPDAFPDSRVRHGTRSGYNLHQRRAERPCDACYLVKQEADARRRSAPERTLRNRAYAAAQQRALRRLRAAHPEEYARYYAEEKLNVKAEASL